MQFSHANPGIVVHPSSFSAVIDNLQRGRTTLQDGCLAANQFGFFPRYNRLKAFWDLYELRAIQAWHKDLGEVIQFSHDLAEEAAAAVADTSDL